MCHAFSNLNQFCTSKPLFVFLHSDPVSKTLQVQVCQSFSKNTMFFDFTLLHHSLEFASNTLYLKYV